MAVPATFHYQGTRTQSPASRICGRVLGTVVGLVIGSFLLVLIGMIASMDVFMPSNGIYRNVSHTNMGVLETVISLAVKNIADRYLNSGNHDESVRTTDHNHSSSLLIRNRSLAFHEELRGQMGAQPPDVDNSSSEVTTPTAEIPVVRLTANQGFGSRNPSLKAARKFWRKR
ncbi:uncharacterized protein LOC119396696 [Rhipicephalus sanguineus]|uniref:Uncharacterized protein n=1 Tax=Rhipicephalus sanguineus TaxID=34632 RepID=A0A9D4PN91_RHISA|nr:uncharacterized protein LOC119396696 [Rhipicephalus sanguineus]KAH7947799.1 hypothetical protein HPB52_015929 [Rhipicephalus sanguineus]